MATQNIKKSQQEKNTTKELEGLEEGLKVEIHVDSLKMTLRNIKLENAKTRWNTLFLVQEILLHSRQSSTRNEKMPTRCTSTQMNDQRKDCIHPKDTSKGTAQNNYRPRTCLPMMWKILTA